MYIDTFAIHGMSPEAYWIQLAKCSKVLPITEVFVIIANVFKLGEMSGCRHQVSDGGMSPWAKSKSKRGLG
jgi:hypothetical protein